jgi:hypothetical protein
MFEKKTVFVLGAGASKPYGFPTGQELLVNLRTRSRINLRQLTGDTVTEDEAANLGRALRSTMLPSIDMLLEHRPDLRQIGKRVMGIRLLQKEKDFLEQKLSEAEAWAGNDWMAWVYQHMVQDAKSVEEFAANPVTFVTFNYDRLIEYRFVASLKHQFNLSGDDCWTQLKRLKFIHLYGSLGPIDPVDETKSVLEFGLGKTKLDGSITATIAPQIADSIKIIHDSVAGSEEFAQASAAIAKADQLVFLGFGFGKDNVQRLNIASTAPRTASYYCSTYGMLPAEIRRKVFEFIPDNADCHRVTGGEPLLAFLRKCSCIADPSWYVSDAP